MAKERHAKIRTVMRQAVLRTLLRNGRYIMAMVTYQCAISIAWAGNAKLTDYIHCFLKIVNVKKHQWGGPALFPFSLTIVPYHTNCEKLWVPVGWQGAVSVRLERAAIYRNVYE